MPKLLVFAPCTKFIVSEEDNSASWIAIMEGLEVGIPAGVTELPANASVPFSWTVATMWYSTPEDSDKEYEQRVQILWPDGRLLAEGIVLFRMTHRTHRNRVNIQSFNVSQPGEQLLRLAIREVGANTDWQEITDYPIMIKHVVEEKQENESIMPSSPAPKGKSIGRRRRKSEETTS